MVAVTLLWIHLHSWKQLDLVRTGVLHLISRGANSSIQNRAAPTPLLKHQVPRLVWLPSLAREQGLLLACSPFHLILTLVLSLTGQREGFLPRVCTGRCSAEFPSRSLRCALLSCERQLLLHPSALTSVSSVQEVSELHTGHLPCAEARTLTSGTGVVQGSAPFFLSLRDHGPS